jgi:hypothetical protein
VAALTVAGHQGDGAPVTVAVITRDRCAQAVQSVDRLPALPERPPVIVVDNGSTDATVAALSQRPGVRLVAAARTRRRRRTRDPARPRGAEALPAGRAGIEVDHVTIYRWVQTLTVECIDAARGAARDGDG